MQVVPAGVHDRDILSAVILGADLAGVGEAGFFFHRKGIEFGAQHDRGPGTVLENGDDAGAADVLGDFVTQAAQAAGELGCRLGLMRRQLRVLVQIDIESVSVGIDGLNFLRYRRRLRAC